jgi:hypothetical protein
MGMIAASCRIELNEIAVRAPKAVSESRLARACEPVYAGKVNWSRAIPGVLERLKRI